MVADNSDGVVHFVVTETVRIFHRAGLCIIFESLVAELVIRDFLVALDCEHLVLVGVDPVACRIGLFVCKFCNESAVCRDLKICRRFYDAVIVAQEHAASFGRCICKIFCGEFCAFCDFDIRSLDNFITVLEGHNVCNLIPLCSVNNVAVNSCVFVKLDFTVKPAAECVFGCCKRRIYRDICIRDLFARFDFD